MKYRITRKEFETLLFQLNGSNPIDRHNVRKESKSVFLYYSPLKDKHGLHEHVATWCAGYGWHFDAPMQRMIDYRQNPESK